MKITILTLFPEMFDGVFKSSILGKSLSKKIWDLEILNIRDFANDKHKQVDDKTYGGGRGRLIKPDVLARAIDFAIDLDKEKTFKVIYPSPRGQEITQSSIQVLTEEEHLIFLCGRYEGIDQRIIDAYDVLEYRIGDFILTGGEIPVMAIIDSVVRLLPGTILNEEFQSEESFNDFLLEYDQFTTPESIFIRGKEYLVDKVLTSGNHNLIKKYRMENAKTITMKRRLDLWAKHVKFFLEK